MKEELIKEMDMAHMVIYIQRAYTCTCHLCLLTQAYYMYNIHLSDGR